MDPKPTGEDKGSTATIELPSVPEPVKEIPLTVADISDGSFTKDEIEAAKRHGLVVDEPKKKEEPKDSKPEVPKPEEKGDEKPAPVPEPLKDENRDTFNLDPEKEKEFQKVFGENQTVEKLYRKMKKNRIQRQDAEAERDHVAIQKKALEQENEKLKRELDERRGPKRGDEDLDLPDLPDEGADEKDGEKPLTRSDLEKIEQEKDERAKKDADTQKQQLGKINDSLDDQQEDAKIRYKDFDTVMDLTHDVMKNLETMFPDPREQKRISLKVRTFLSAAAHADKFALDDFNPADMAYEIGQLHPKYKPGGTGKEPQPADEGADLDPDKLNRIVTNASRRSSASINGGSGRRLVSVDNLTSADLADMPADKFRELRKARPDIVERLLRQ